MNTTILQLVAVCELQLHVSALYVGHHHVVQRTYSVTTQNVWEHWEGKELSSYIVNCGISYSCQHFYWCVLLHV